MIQTTLILIVSALIILDAYITYMLYKQAEKDYTDLKYDIEIVRTLTQSTSRDVAHHKDHINALIDNISDLNNITRKLTQKTAVGRPRKVDKRS